MTAFKITFPYSGHDCIASVYTMNGKVFTITPSDPKDFHQLIYTIERLNDGSWNGIGGPDTLYLLEAVRAIERHERDEEIASTQGLPV